MWQIRGEFCFLIQFPIISKLAIFQISMGGLGGKRASPPPIKSIIILIIYHEEIE
jgi:hypothetical protein